MNAWQDMTTDFRPKLVSVMFCTTSITLFAMIAVVFMDSGKSVRKNWTDAEELEQVVQQNGVDIHRLTRLLLTLSAAHCVQDTSSAVAEFHGVLLEVVVVL